LCAELTMYSLINPRLLIAILLTAAVTCPAQMTKEQKVADFSQLAAVYAINYGPLQWKRDALQVDLLNIGEWLSQAARTTDDLDFYELCVAYVASLNDAHDLFCCPLTSRPHLASALTFMKEKCWSTASIESAWCRRIIHFKWAMSLFRSIASRRRT
jgi:hypothetical protein